MSITPSESASFAQMRDQIQEGIQEGLIEPMQTFYAGNAKINRDQISDISAVLAETLARLDSTGTKLTSNQVATMIRDDQDMHMILVSFIDTMKSIEKDDYNLLMDLFKGEKTYEE